MPLQNLLSLPLCSSESKHSGQFSFESWIPMRRFGRRCGTVNIADLLLYIIILICISFRRFFLTKIRTFRSSSGLLHPSSQCLSYVHLFKCVMVFCYTKYSKSHVPFVKHFILRIYCLVITFFFIVCSIQSSTLRPVDIRRTSHGLVTLHGYPVDV